MVYLDDGWVRSSSFQECMVVSDIVKSDLLAAGLVPNKDKSFWIPTQRIDWLGITWDGVYGSINHGS